VGLLGYEAGDDELEGPVGAGSEEVALIVHVRGDEGVGLDARPLLRLVNDRGDHHALAAGVGGRQAAAEAQVNLCVLTAPIPDIATESRAYDPCSDLADGHEPLSLRRPERNGNEESASGDDP
jgi:hypothetical protein